MEVKPLAGAVGPRIWANWHAKRSGPPLRGIVELKLFTDAWIIAECGRSGVTLPWSLADFTLP
jgi:hypothetical protein